MKLYYHPVSTTSRPILLFAAESGIQLELQVVDLMTGEHLGADYTKINPNQQVPVLEDGDFRLTESSSILKYLADKIDSPAYPKDLKARARVNEAMDWLNANLYRDYGYGLVYPQTFPHHKRPDDAVQAGTVKWAQEKSKRWLQIMNDHWIGPKKTWLCGDSVTLADYFGAPIITIGEVIGSDFAQYPNVARWLKAVKELPSWPKVNEAFEGLKGAFAGNRFEKV
jgi:glutathione S-transferase